MFDMQALVDGMGAQWQRERAATQMTLGKLINVLAEMPPEKKIEGFGRPHSYRGYYSDLAFERTEGQISATDLLDICRSAMGEVFEGYKGGDFQMGQNTPVWIANYGNCGQKIMAILGDGTLELAENE